MGTFAAQRPRPFCPRPDTQKPLWATHSGSPRSRMGRLQTPSSASGLPTIEHFGDGVGLKPGTDGRTHESAETSPSRPYRTLSSGMVEAQTCARCTAAAAEEQARRFLSGRVVLCGRELRYMAQEVTMAMPSLVSGSSMSRTRRPELLRAPCASQAALI